MFTWEGCFDGNAEDAKGWLERFADCFSVCMKGLDSVVIGIVGDLDDLIDTIEDRFCGFAEGAWL
jgi:hypothetical protein